MPEVVDATQCNKLQAKASIQRAFKIRGLTWVVERSFAWLGRYRRFIKDYEFKVQTSETLSRLPQHALYQSSEAVTLTGIPELGWV